MPPWSGEHPLIPPLPLRAMMHLIMMSPWYLADYAPLCLRTIRSREAWRPWRNGARRSNMATSLEIPLPVLIRAHVAFPSIITICLLRPLVGRLVGLNTYNPESRMFEIFCQGHVNLESPPPLDGMNANLQRPRIWSVSVIILILDGLEFTRLQIPESFTEGQRLACPGPTGLNGTIEIPPHYETVAEVHCTPITDNSQFGPGFSTPRAIQTRAMSLILTSQELRWVAEIISGDFVVIYLRVRTFTTWTSRHLAQQ